MRNKNNITVVIHTHNEEKNIDNCINSALLLSNSIIVVDMKSSDSTIKRAKKRGACIVSVPFSKYVEPARNIGIAAANTPWVFLLDADERITKKLAQEILATIQKMQYSHFRLPRKNIFAQRAWLKHGGWWPDMQIRLIHKPSFITWPNRIHATPKMKGVCGVLKNALIHFFHPNLENMVMKTAIYENIEADLLFKAKRRASTIVFFRKFAGELIRRLIIKRGYRDGAYGIIESLYQAYSKTITWLFVYEKQLKNSSKQI